MRPADIAMLVVPDRPSLTADGDAVVFAVASSDLEANEGRSALWLGPRPVGASGGPPARPVTGGPHRDLLPRCSPPGTPAEVAFVRVLPAAAGNHARIELRVLTLAAPGESRVVAVLDEAPADLAWSPDGAWLAWVAPVADPRRDAPLALQEPRRIRRLVNRLDGSGWLLDRPAHVWCTRTDGTWARPLDLTPGEHRHDGVAWLGDASGVVTVSARHDTADLDDRTDLWMVPVPPAGRPVAAGEARRLTDTSTFLGGGLRVSPDGTRVATYSAEPASGPRNARPTVVDLASGGITVLATTTDRSFGGYPIAAPPLWWSDTRLVAPMEDRGRVHVVDVDVTDPTAPVVVRIGGERAVRTLDLHAPTRTLAATVVDPVTPGEVVWVPETGPERRLTAFSERLPFRPQRRRRPVR